MKRAAVVESFEAFEREWSLECAEWQALAVTLGPDASAFDVSQEHRRRMAARGDVSVLDTAFARRHLGGLRLVRS